MLTSLIFSILASLTGTTTDVAQELAHQTCEIVVYAALAPGIPDDAVDQRAEPTAERLCRWW